MFTQIQNVLATLENNPAYLKSSVELTHAPTVLLVFHTHETKYHLGEKKFSRKNSMLQVLYNLYKMLAIGRSVEKDRNGCRCWKVWGQVGVAAVS